MRAYSPEEIKIKRSSGNDLAKATNLNPSKFAILSTFNMELIVPYLRDSLGTLGINPEVYVGKFGQMNQEIINVKSDFYSFDADNVVIVPAIEDLLDPIFDSTRELTTDEIENLVEQRISDLDSLLHLLLERMPKLTCYVVAFGTSKVPNENILNPLSQARGQIYAEQLMQSLKSLENLSPRVTLVDWDWHARGIGLDQLQDERLWYVGRMRLNQIGLINLSELITKYVAANRNSAKKVVVVDLDNTIWGGVIGEDGLENIILGEEGLGLAFKDFQKDLIQLSKSGVILAICSKNNEADAWEVFENHTSMSLTREHFSTYRINWSDKASNIREMSDELDLGLDSFVFLDDNPVEREWVRTALPEVLVPDLPEDPADRSQYLRNSTYFQRLELTEADLKRSESYRTNSIRRKIRDSSLNMDDFLRSLEQEIIFDPLSKSSLSRAAQMSQRTNQFNLTTRRYTASDLEPLIDNPDFEIFTLSVKDKFSDNGITGLAILDFTKQNAEIDTFLMSCRVLGRMVEDKFINFLIQRATMRDFEQLIGIYIETNKNSQVKNFYESHGFEELNKGIFRLDLKESIKL